MKKSSGFTLIEILVVISVIGVLSSLVLAGVAGARDKARVAKTEQFEASMYHAIGDTLEAKFDFDKAALDGSGNGTAIDQTNNSNTVAIHSAALSNVTPDGAGQAVVLSGAPASYAQSNYQVDFNAPLTVGAWIKTTSSANMTIVSMPTQYWNYELDLFNGQVVVHVPINASAYEQVVGAGKLNDGKWHQVEFTLDPSRRYAIYQDGSIASSGTLVNVPALFPKAQFSIGLGTGFGNWNGSIDNVSVYNAYTGN